MNRWPAKPSRLRWRVALCATLCVGVDADTVDIPNLGFAGKECFMFWTHFSFNEPTETTKRKETIRKLLQSAFMPFTSYDDIDFPLSQIDEVVHIDPSQDELRLSLSKYKQISSATERDTALIFYYNGRGVPPIQQIEDTACLLLLTDRNEPCGFPIKFVTDELGPVSLSIIDQNYSGLFITQGNLKTFIRDNRIAIVLCSCRQNESNKLSKTIPCDIFTSALVDPLRTSLFIMLLKNDIIVEDPLAIFSGKREDPTSLLGELHAIMSIVKWSVIWGILARPNNRNSQNMDAYLTFKAMRTNYKVFDLVGNYFIAYQFLSSINMPPFSNLSNEGNNGEISLDAILTSHPLLAQVYWYVEYVVTEYIVNRKQVKRESSPFHLSFFQYHMSQFLDCLEHDTEFGSYELPILLLILDHAVACYEYTENGKERDINYKINMLRFMKIMMRNLCMFIDLSLSNLKDCLQICFVQSIISLIKMLAKHFVADNQKINEDEPSSCAKYYSKIWFYIVFILTKIAAHKPKILCKIYKTFEITKKKTFQKIANSCNNDLLLMLRMSCSALYVSPDLRIASLYLLKELNSYKLSEPCKKYLFDVSKPLVGLPMLHEVLIVCLTSHIKQIKVLALLLLANFVKRYSNPKGNNYINFNEYEINNVALMLLNNESPEVRAASLHFLLMQIKNNNYDYRSQQFALMILQFKHDLSPLVREEVLSIIKFVIGKNLNDTISIMIRNKVVAFGLISKCDADKFMTNVLLEELSIDSIDSGDNTNARNSANQSLKNSLTLNSFSFHSGSLENKESLESRQSLIITSSVPVLDSERAAGQTMKSFKDQLDDSTTAEIESDTLVEDDFIQLLKLLINDFPTLTQNRDACILLRNCIHVLYSFCASGNAEFILRVNEIITLLEKIAANHIYKQFPFNCALQLYKLPEEDKKDIKFGKTRKDKKDKRASADAKTMGLQSDSEKQIHRYIPCTVNTCNLPYSVAFNKLLYGAKELIFPSYEKLLQREDEIFLNEVIKLSPPSTKIDFSNFNLSFIPLMAIEYGVLLITCLSHYNAYGISAFGSINGITGLPLYLGMFEQNNVISFPACHDVQGNDKHSSGTNPNELDYSSIYSSKNIDQSFSTFQGTPKKKTESSIYSGLDNRIYATKLLGTFNNYLKCNSTSVNVELRSVLLGFLYWFNEETNKYVCALKQELGMNPKPPDLHAMVAKCVDAEDYFQDARRFTIKNTINMYFKEPLFKESIVTIGGAAANMINASPNKINRKFGVIDFSSIGIPSKFLSIPSYMFVKSWVFDIFQNTYDNAISRVLQSPCPELSSISSTPKILDVKNIEAPASKSYNSRNALKRFSYYKKIARKLAFSNDDARQGDTLKTISPISLKSRKRRSIKANFESIFSTKKETPVLTPSQSVSSLRSEQEGSGYLSLPPVKYNKYGLTIDKLAYSIPPPFIPSNPLSLRYDVDREYIQQNTQYSPEAMARALDRAVQISNSFEFFFSSHFHIFQSAEDLHVAQSPKADEPTHELWKLRWEQYDKNTQSQLTKTILTFSCEGSEQSCTPKAIKSQLLSMGSESSVCQSPDSRALNENPTNMNFAKTVEAESCCLEKLQLLNLVYIKEDTPKTVKKQHVKKTSIIKNVMRRPKKGDASTPQSSTEPTSASSNSSRKQTILTITNPKPSDVLLTFSSTDSKVFSTYDLDKPQYKMFNQLIPLFPEQLKYNMYQIEMCDAAVSVAEDLRNAPSKFFSMGVNKRVKKRRIKDETLDPSELSFKMKRAFSLPPPLQQKGYLCMNLEFDRYKPLLYVANGEDVKVLNYNSNNKSSVNKNITSQPLETPGLVNVITCDRLYYFKNNMVHKEKCIYCSKFQYNNINKLVGAETSSSSFILKQKPFGIEAITPIDIQRVYKGRSYYLGSGKKMIAACSDNCIRILDDHIKWPTIDCCIELDHVPLAAHYSKAHYYYHHFYDSYNTFYPKGTKVDLDNFNPVYGNGITDTKQVEPGCADILEYMYRYDFIRRSMSYKTLLWKTLRSCCQNPCANSSDYKKFQILGKAAKPHTRITYSYDNINSALCYYENGRIISYDLNKQVKTFINIQQPLHVLHCETRNELSNLLYFANFDCTLYCIDKRVGKQVRSFKLDKPITNISTPLLDQNSIAVNANAFMAKIDLPTNTIKNSYVFDSSGCASWDCHQISGITATVRRSAILDESLHSLGTTPITFNTHIYDQTLSECCSLPGTSFMDYVVRDTRPSCLVYARWHPLFPILAVGYTSDRSCGVNVYSFQRRKSDV